MGELIVYQSLRRPSVNILNIFSSETTGPIKLKFHMDSFGRGNESLLNCTPGHMTKMAAMPIYGKNPLEIF